MMADDLERRRQLRERRRQTAPVGAFGPSGRRRRVIDRVMTRVEDQSSTYGTPEPSRITIALDARGLYGPEVDAACGVEEPAVDEWEAGTRIPTREQVMRLAALTQYPLPFFYGPPIETGGAWMCGEDGCERF